MIGKSQAVLLALLLALPTAFLGAAVLTTQAQTTYSAWLKIVTDSWDGAAYGGGFTTPVNPVGIDFPGRYNATNVCVFLVHFKAGLTQWDPPVSAGSPNGTGFIQVSWPASWPNVTIIVKAKSYQGDCIGGPDPFRGIIVYWLTVSGTPSFYEKFFGTGITSGNRTVGDDGIRVDHGGNFDWNYPAPFGSGPVDAVDYASGPVTLSINHNDPRNAWVARAAYIFKLFHEHTWYATYDNLTYATIFIYDTDHTEAGSTQSLIQAAITGGDGQSRYTREIYPASAGRGEFDSRPGKFANNNLVPIPLQTLNLGNHTPFHGGIGAPSGTNRVGAAHLNATKRVWWETVLTNQTLYVGRQYNGSDTYTLDPGTDKYRPGFGGFAANLGIPSVTQGGVTGIPAGPFSLALNNTVGTGADNDFWYDDTTTEGGFTRNVADFNNNTVFYARFCVQDADLKIQHFEVGDKMVGAEVTIDLKRTGDVQPYYLSHNILTTDNGGCTDTPHKWPGYTSRDKLSPREALVDNSRATWFDKMARFPNATNWGLRGSLNVSKAFDPRDDVSPVWRPGGYFHTQWQGDWRGPYNNAGKNWSALIPEITYMKTRTLTDDINYDGFDVNVRWAGGSRNSYMSYGARPVLVDSIRVPNPYAIATLYNYATERIWGRWVFPTTPLANNKLLVYVHTADRIEIDIDTNGNGVRDYTRTLTGSDVIQKTLEITGAFSIEMNDADYDGVWDFIEITRRPGGWMTLNIVENRTDPWVDYTNVTAIQLVQALVTVKKHDSFWARDGDDGIVITFGAESGVVDFNADGLDIQTGVLQIIANSGPAELEIWPGAPGDNQQKILLSAHDITVWYGDSLSGNIQRANFTGTLLAYGTVIELEVFENETQRWSDDSQTSDVEISLSSLDARPRFPSPLGPSGGRPAAGYPTGSRNNVVFGAGVVFETLPKSVITGIGLEAQHNINVTTILAGTGRVGLYKGWWDPDPGPPVVGFTGTVELALGVGEPIRLWSKVVPLRDFSNDDRDYDDWIFGGYDDFALTGSGIVYITAWVHDIGYRVLDNMGNTLPAARTTVTLTGGDGGTLAVPKSGVGGDPDRLVGGLQFSYKVHGDGWAVFYQLPGDHYYGVTVTFDGAVVYQQTIEIAKLIKTEMVDIVTNVVKAKLVFVDCNGQPVGGAWIRYTDPSGRSVITKISDFGELDLGFTAGGTMVVRGLWWKGVWVPFDRVTVGSAELPINPDGSVNIVLDRNLDSPPVFRAVINDFIFTPWDYNMDNRIPRLNITVMWVGVAPTTGERLYFVQTLDPTGDTWDGNLPGNDPSDDNNPRNDYNTSVNLHQWFSYKIEYRQGDITTSRGLKTYGRVQYIFYQMPPAYYNITVTTTPHLYTGGHGGADWGTPATSKWPGRTDAPVEYEAKILWGSPDASTFSLNDLRNPPLEAWRRASYSSSTGRWSFSGGPDGTWAAYANDRIVLRVFGTIGGIPVTDPDLNPGGVGNQTARICGTRNIDLITWAHTFNKRVVDGDFDYLNDARRIGNATFNIVNDNGIQMEEYYPDTQTFSTEFVSRWTSDLLDTTWLKADSQFSSTIWWNGSYRAENLRFVSYVYPLEFTRGEEPWARFYNKVGLTPPGVLTTEDGPMNAGPDPEVSPNSFLVDRWFNLTTPWAARGTWPRHNFTVVGNEGLWNQQRWRWERAVARGLVPEVPTRPYSLVFEKQVVTFPIPVGFITLNLKDEDLARAIPFAVVDLSIFTRTSNTTSTATLDFSAVYKTGVNGNLTLLYPTQEFLEVKPIDSNRPFVVNYTLTVFWYLNSSIVYKDAFNLTKRGYSVDRVGIADVTFVLAISADKDRPVQDLYARIWWVNVTDGSTTFPGRITVDTARRTWTYTAVPETRGAAKWTTGSLTLPWLPASERFTKSDHDLTFDTTARRWTYSSVTRTWDIPYPSNADGVMIPGWPYQPRPTGYYRALTYTQDARIQYRISVWSDQLPIDPTSAAYGRGAWSRAAPAAAAGDHYELVWTRLSTGDDSAPMFRFAWMLFGPSPFDITFYRGPDGVGIFQAIPGYALTRTWERTPTPGSKTVAIKLNATDVQIPVFWQVGDWELGTYDCGPLVGYVVKGQIRPPAGATYGPITIDATTTAGYITVGDKRIDICLVGKPVGLVTYRSGSTVPTVVWGSSWYSAGSRLIVEEVSPPPSIWFDDGTGQAGADNPNRGTTSSYWRNWVSQAIDPVTGQPVRLTVGDQQSIPGVDLGIQYMGYGRPYEGRPREHSVIVFSNDHDNRAHRPFIKMFEFQNVSARITDFNGRALPGAFYQIIDAQTGKSAAWSYAGPDGRIVPMPIRKPGGVFIQRVTYLGQGANGEPTWPVNSFAKWPIAYDSRDDETTQETQKPDIPLGFAYTAEAGPWPTGPGWFPFGNNPSSGPVCDWIDGDHFYDYYDGTWVYITGFGYVFDIRSDTDILEWIAACPPAGWGRSFDVITRIFDLRVRFVYGDAQRPVDPAYVFTAPSLALPDQFTIRGQGGIFEAKRLARSTYDIIALWPNAQGEEVGRRTFDVSRVNVGTVEGTVVLALRDVSFTVVDRQGRPVSGARVSVSPNLMRQDDVQLRPDGVFTLLRIPDGRTYDFTVEWTSPFGTTARAAVRESPQGLQNRGSITIPVDDISIKVVDFDDRPVAGADIGFGGQAVGKTDSQGVVIIGQVPLDNTYAVTVTKDGTQIGSDNIRFTSSRTSATLQAGIYDITVLVKGAAGQPIQGALVELVRGGTTIARVATDSSGTAVFGKVVGADYTVRAAYEAFSSSANLARGTRSTTITLDLYTVLLGVPMTFATFLALIIGLILLIIVVVVVVSEYIRWRGRRLGIYPAAPPKK